MICALFLITVLYFGILNESKEDDTKNDQNNGENNSTEPEYDVDIFISADKTNYTSSETIKFTLTVVSNMNISFPYENHSFTMWYVNKSDYDGSGGFSPVDMPEVQSAIDLIRVEPGEKSTSYVDYNLTDVDSGEYYFQFLVQVLVDSSGSIVIVDITMCEVTIA